MPSYVIAYHGGKAFESPEAGAAHMAKWQVWMGGLGEAMINPGTPLRKSKFLTAGGVSAEGEVDPLTGYSIVKADSLEAAIGMAKGCPHLEIGTIEVAEAVEM